MPKNPSKPGQGAAPAGGRRNFRLSSLEILITVLIFVGLLYLATLWATNALTPSEEAATPSVPPGAMVERALAASEKVLAEQISQSRDLTSLRKQVESLQGQSRKAPHSAGLDPVDAAQDRRMDDMDSLLGQVNHKVNQLPDMGLLQARLEKLEKEAGLRPAGASASAAVATGPLADPQMLARLDKLEKDLAAKPSTGPAQAPAAPTDAKVLARLERLEKDLASRPAPTAAPSGGGQPDPQLLARLDKLEKELAVKPPPPNPAAAALAQMEGRLQRLESGLLEARAGQARPAPLDPQLLARLERLEKALAQGTAAAPGTAPAPRAAAQAEPKPTPAPKAATQAEPKRVSHKVRSGETLGGLARRYKVSEADIVRWNSMGTRRLLLIGESIVIFPGQSS